MDTLVNVTTTRELYAEMLGAPLLGASLTYTLTSPTGATLIAAQPVTEVGAGFYAYSVDGSTYLTGPGLYRERWSGSSGSTDLQFDDAFLVGYAAGPVTTRLQLRHDIAHLLRDLWRGQATGGSPSTLLDTDRVETTNAWQGAQIYLYAGTGAGQSRNLLSSTQSGGVLTVAKSWTVNPDTTTLYELHRRFSVDAYNDAINAVIRSLADKPLIRAVDETVTLTTGTYEYAIPAGFSFISKVAWRDTTTTADWSDLRRRDDWEIIPGHGKLRIPGPATNMRLRLEGHLAPTAMLRDAAYCDLNPMYLMYLTASLLVQSEIAAPGRDLNAAGQAAAGYLAQAREFEPRQRDTANAVRV